MSLKFALGYLVISLIFLLAAGGLAISGRFTIYDVKFGSDITFEGLGLILLVISFFLFSLCAWLAYREARSEFPSFETRNGAMISGMAGVIVALIAWARAGGVIMCHPYNKARHRTCGRCSRRQAHE